MKWTNKGSELTYRAKDWTEIIDLNEGIYVFGAGEMAKSLCVPLYHFNLISGVIDNNTNRHGELFEGKEIMSLEEALINRKKEIILIACNKDNTSVISQQLKEAGLVENKDYFYGEEFMNGIFPVLLSVQKEKNYVELVQISLTERCTLKCKKCAHACHLVPADRVDLTLEEAKESADQFFRFTDYVKYFVLIGGEPLLYRELVPIIEYISQKYRDRIEKLQITTNGTIVPSENILQCCKENDVYFMISNYTKQVEWAQRQVPRLVDALDKNNIKYALFPEETNWMDYGFDYYERNASEEQLITVFDACHTGCHEIRKNRFYYCVMARSVSENMWDGKIGQDDYLDLNILNDKELSDRSIFLEYTLGYSESGYLEMCNFCHGIESENYPIKAAEQVEGYVNCV